MDELQANRALATAIRAVTLFSIFSVLVLLLAFEILQLRTRGWAGAATLSLALLVGGYLVGLLFAVPKTPGAEGLATTNTDTLAAVSSDGSSAQGLRTVSQRRVLLVNTSFEQISDWLTKIIVGVGLVQFQPILTFMEAKTWELAVDLSGSVASAPDAEPVAAGILIAYPALGVLLGFFSVRLYIAWAIYVADVDSSQPLDTFTDNQKKKAAAAAAVPSASSVIRRGGNVTQAEADAPAASVQLAPATAKAVDQILDKRLSQLSSVNDIVAWGRACLVRGRYYDARDAFADALAMGDPDPTVALDYVEALYHLLPINYDAMIATLESVLPHLDLTVAVDVRHRVFENLINAYLYLSRPQGFTKAIDLANRYVAGDGKGRYAAFVYLAAAHGQRYSYLKKQADADAGQELPLIIQLVREAIKIGKKKAREWLARLTNPDGDDDLVTAFQDSAELRELLEPDRP